MAILGHIQPHLNIWVYTTSVPFLLGIALDSFLVCTFAIALVMATLMDILWSLPTPLLLLFLICLYYVGVAVYRLYFSPLAKFPGPKLAALTYWVEFYHDVIRRGQFTFEIGKLHDKYGKH